jgi:hypothetical protein
MPSLVRPPPRFPPRLGWSRTGVAAATFWLALGGVSRASAETCPEVPDGEVGLRRSMAKEWFAKAEEAEAGGDGAAAVRRYACSLNLAPHPSTAYNLGTVAEKAGDLSMAVDAFRTYLKLAPEAADRPLIETRVATLEAKVAELRRELAPRTPPAATPNLALAPTQPPPAATTLATAPTTTDASGHRRRVAGWLSLGGAAATLGAAVTLNLMARSDVDACYAMWATTQQGKSLDKCDSARPLAYTSYGLFGAAGVLGVVGAALLLSHTEESATPVALVPSGGGASVIAAGRF